ncbi:unnamed protein product [Amaranthus hypochondriacus]
MQITHPEKSPQLCPEMESHDTKYVSGFSTLLVATIQDAKDRISQIEYIFCSQLYPNIQQHSKSLQKLYLEARTAAENECKERQTELELQMKQESLEKERALDECKAEKSRLLARVAELEDKLSQKEKEVDEGMELHAKLLDIIEAKNTSLREKEESVKNHEEKIKFLVIKSEELERIIDELNKELQDKNEVVTKANESVKEFQMQIESREKLAQQVNWYESEVTKKDEQLSAYESDKQTLSSRINHLQHKCEELQESLRNVNAHSALVKQIEQKDSELTEEKQKRSDLLFAYKNLKSQQCYLLKKFGLTNEELLQMKAEKESDPSNNDQTRSRISEPVIVAEIKRRKPASNGVACELNKVKQETNNTESSDDEKISRPNQMLISKSSAGSEPATKHWITSKKAGSLAGEKRPASGWRETRSRQSPGGPDPHDDFLDTPFENIKGNLQKTMKDTVLGGPAVSLKDADSDGETQDMTGESQPKRQQLQIPRPDSKGFKYVEPVRKKDAREKLTGIECKQCKKFYDAVHADNREGDIQNLRCEHHDGVSRHRYRYAPPLTPDGFWNIGFDSEI